MLLCFQFSGGAWLTNGDPNICIQVDPWLSVNVTHNIGDVVHQQVHKQHSNVIESFIHISSYSTPCFINSLSFLLWIKVEYFCWKKGMCQCSTKGYFHPLGLIYSFFPTHRVLLNKHNLLNICDLTNHITSFKFNYFLMLPNILCSRMTSQWMKHPYSRKWYVTTSVIVHAM